MDLRVEKTEKAIKNAFIELRSQKPLEKITVKELCAEARINKSTFYSHYQDIYALSEAMEKETVSSRLYVSDIGDQYRVFGEGAEPPWQPARPGAQESDLPEISRV